MLRHVVLLKLTGVSEVLFALMMKAVNTCETLVTYPICRHHVVDNYNDDQY
jgi:hypothetical protein